MGRVGLPELFIILFIVILIFGANRLPQLATGIGKSIREFQGRHEGGRGQRHLASSSLLLRSRRPGRCLRLFDDRRCSCFGRALLCRGPRRRSSVLPLRESQPAPNRSDGVPCRRARPARGRDRRADRPSACSLRAANGSSPESGSNRPPCSTRARALRRSARPAERTIRTPRRR